MKLVKISGHIYFLILLILSVLYYRARTMYVDPACQVFEMINNGGFKIYVERYSMILNQLLPVLALKLHAPLKMVLISYSVSFILIYYVCFLLSVYVFKNLRAGLGIIFTVVVVRSMFFHSISETWLGLSYCSLFYAIINYQFSSKKSWINNFGFFSLSFVLIIINYYMHAITMFPLLFLLAYTVVDKKDFKNYRYYVLLTFILVLFLAKFFFGANEHEDQFFAELKNFRQNLPNILHSPTTHFFFQYRLGPIYIYALIPLIILFIKQLYNKEYMRFVLQAGATFFLLLIIILAFFKGDSEICLESRFLPITLFIFIPFLNEILLTKGYERLKYFAGVFLITVSLIGIYQAHIRYQARNYAMIRMLEQTKKAEGSKFVCDVKNFPQNDQLIVKWGIAIESLLCSSVHGPDSARTIFLTDDINSLHKEIYTDPDIFLQVPWWIYFKEKDLNHRYFRLKPGGYKEIPEFKLQN